MVLASSRALWYMTRATGLVSLVLLTLSVVLGIVEAVRWTHPRWPRFVTAGLHKNVSLLVTAFLAVHILTAVADPFAPIRWLDVVVPFTSRYRPVWLGLGAVAFDLMVALVITSLWRERLGYRAWRAVHWAAYACWPVALIHGLGTGTDVRVRWALALQIGSLAAVAMALDVAPLERLRCRAQPGPGHRGRRCRGCGRGHCRFRAGGTSPTRMGPPGRDAIGVVRPATRAAAARNGATPAGSTTVPATPRRHPPPAPAPPGNWRFRSPHRCGARCPRPGPVLTLP